MSVLNNATLANSRTPYYALAGESGSNWYTFSSLTGKVFLTDDTGNHVIQAVGNDLFYDNELLAKASDLQDIGDWSLYPALSTILMNGNIIQECSSIQVSSITSANIATATLEASGVITGGTLATVPGPYNPGDVKTQTVTATSISASGNIQGGSMTTVGGIDMTNTGLTRTSNIGLSAFGAPPYGNLTSPDGSSLTWNGASINTGAAGSASQWANYPAVANVNMNNNYLSNVATVYGGQYFGSLTETTTVAAGAPGGGKYLLMNNSSIGAGQGALAISSSNDLTMATTAGDMKVDVYNNFELNSGNDVSIKADGGINPLITTQVNLTSQNGIQGQVNITANPGSIVANGGLVKITANGGTTYIPQPPPEPPLAITVGGLIELDANTGGLGLYTATSAIKMSAAGINSYAGAIPSIGSLIGYNFIYGTLGVSLCAGLPASGVQFPGTVYIYGVGVPGIAGGVRLQSPQGIQMLSDTYMENVYPLDGNGLTIQGRSLPTGYVKIKDIDQLTMNYQTAIQTDRINSVTNLGILFQDGIQATSIRPPIAVTAGNPNLVIAGYSNIFNVQNYVALQNVSTLAFDPTASGALTGVQSINGSSWPPPTGDASLWADYPAVNRINASGLGISSVSSLTEVSSINGLPYAALDTGLWATYPAVQAVDMSGFGLTNVASMNVLDNFALASVSSLGIFTDGGDLSIAADNGGNVNIGTGNAGNISIQTIGAGHNLNLGGDTIYIGAEQGVNMTATLDMVSNNIINVSTIIGAGGTTELRIQNTGTGGTAILDLDGGMIIASQFQPVTVIGGSRLNLNTGSGDITLMPQGGLSTIRMLGNSVIGTTIEPKNLAVNGGITATGDVVALSASSAPVSLSTIGGLVAGIPSGFRDQTEFYVSSDGNDTTGLGSILSPYATIQKAITQAELVSSAALVCVINVASGHYTENLTFNTGYVILNGSLQSQTGNEVCEITGSISIAVTGPSDIFNRQITFQGFNITCSFGQSVTDTSTTPHTVSFQDCKCFVVNQFFVSTTSAADMRLYLTNVEIQQTSAASAIPIIITNVGQLEFERLDISVSGNCSAIVVGGTSILSRFSLSALETTNTSATLLPLLSFTSTNLSTHTLGNVAFAFSSAVTKTATSAVYIASGVNTTLLMLNSVFSLQGTSSSTNYTVGYNAVGSPAILGINNTSLNVPVLLPQTTAVQAGITQIAYTDINPPVMGAYSKSNDQTIAAANTPVAIVFNTTQFQQGTALATTRLQVAASGNYQVNYQVQTTNSISATITTYLSKNGTAIINTGSQYTQGAGSQAQTSPQFIVSLNAGDYIELFINSNSLGTSVNSTAGAGSVPAIPGAIITVTQIR